ncbi:type VII secretion-associated serine protease mycosin [Mycobacterium sp. ACS1612]|uniref:type VII secretion-associated serine protease mycosin n=1 Tax=Mycobacterium sp. ACS1612 TaxID=1834117 RepID=UPI0007FEB18D|nr:type VII secretion-associated serine protease mycosin [Mycobacterium sp. ACS1612]
MLLVVGGAMAPACAVAIEPPQVPPGPPPAGPVAPPGPTEQKAVCGMGTVFPNTQFRNRTIADTLLDYKAAWRFSRGAGQKVAVIDTGVMPNPRLPGLQPGGDYVSASNGLVDCDAHGTLVAGLIAAAPSTDDAFAGVAPDATILSIRQASGAYGAQGTGARQNDPNATSPGYGSTQTLALAIVHAVDLGATVINISDVACAAVGAGMDDAAVGQAVRYAFERNVVVVAATGDLASEGLCSAQNEVRDPNLPLADGWRTARTIASPAWFGDYVLAVGAVTPDARPSEFSLHGPWVDVAAPGEKVSSLDPNGVGLVNAFPDGKGGMVPLNGTGFAAPLVSGVVALVRSRFPELSAAQVMNLIKRTAHTPQAGPNAETGYGVVDPVAALTYQLPPAASMDAPPGGQPISGSPRQDPSSSRFRNIVLVAVSTCVALAAIAVAVIKKPAQ